MNRSDAATANPTPRPTRGVSSGDLNACYAIVGSNGRLAETSAALAQLLGHERELLNGKPLAELVHPDEAAHLADRLASARSADQPVRGSFRLRRSQGGDVLVELSLIPCQAGPDRRSSLVVRADLPGRNAAVAEALRDSEAHYASVISALAQGIVVQDLHGVVSDCNSAAERILGMDASALIDGSQRGQGWGAIDENGRPLPLDAYPPMQALRSGKSVSSAVAIRKPDGNLAWLSVSSVPLQHEGETTPYGVVSSISDMTEIREKEKQLEYSSGHDSLTDLPNRLEFFEVARRAFGDESRKQAVRDAVLFLDLDDFKRVNDMFGHTVGDQLLVQAALRIRQCIRPGDVAARLAGDEFALLLLNVGSVWNAVRVAQRVLESFTEPFRLAGVALDLSTSVGISVAAEGARDPDVVISQADIALRRAKTGGKARYVVYDAHLDARVKDNLEIEADLRQALGKGEFEVHYQPVVELFSGAVAGAETLLRWHHPKRDLVPPAEFIPVAEDNGTIHPIGEWVLEQSLTQLKSWLERYPGLHLGINLSPRQLESPQFLTTFARILGVSGVPHDAVMLELTETYLMQDVERAARDLRRFAGLGVQIAIDDFGTGYSSLKYLQHLPITHLKIDRSFIHRVVRDERSRVLVEAIQLLADKLELKVIAEGVETQAQADFLTATGCRWAQGYLFERPMPAANFDDYLRQAPKGRAGG
jgi:diguanylate cyclase (GGDEF)-like protein/PAS domain S-box-containing protein